MDYITCDYCGTPNKSDGEVLSCQKCGAPLRWQKQGLVDTLFGGLRAALVGSPWPVVGVDVSHWQGVMDWDRALAAGAGFAFIKASEGNGYQDPQFDRNRVELDKRHIPFGVYHFLKPDKDWKKQAEFFAQAAVGALPPVVDVERAYGDKAFMAGFVQKFVNRFEELTGRPPMIYTSPGFWNSYLPRTDFAKRHRLWIAHYTTASAPTLPADWGAINNPVSWTFWQHSAGGNRKGAEFGAQSKDIDLNRYWGTAAEFKAEFGVAPAALPADEPDPEPAPAAAQWRVLQDGLRIRSGPGTSYSILGALPAGKVLPQLMVYGQDVWVQVAPGEWVNAYYGADQNMELVERVT
jgi:lysozyme